MLPRKILNSAAFLQTQALSSVFRFNITCGKRTNSFGLGDVLLVNEAKTSVESVNPIRHHTSECGPNCKEHHHHHPHHSHDQHRKHDHSHREVGKECGDIPKVKVPSEEPTVEHACWSCDSFVRRGGLVCGSCDKIQPVDTSLNYFELFSLDPKSPDCFEVNLSELENSYRRLQWRLHPDRAVRKTALEREFSKEQASTVNHAYSVLKSPLARANYLLMLKGVNAGDNFEGSISDPELLMEVLEAREEVEETEDQGRLTSMLNDSRAREQNLVARVSNAFRANDLEEALQLVHQLTYVVKLQQEITQKLDKSI